MAQVMTQSMLEAKIEKFLNAKHCSQWGRSFDIVNPNTRPQCVNFIVDMVKELHLVSIVKEREISDDPLNGYASEDYT